MPMRPTDIIVRLIEELTGSKPAFNKEGGITEIGGVGLPPSLTSRLIQFPGYGKGDTPTIGGPQTGPLQTGTPLPVLDRGAGAMAQGPSGAGLTPQTPTPRLQLKFANMGRVPASLGSALGILGVNPAMAEPSMNLFPEYLAPMGAGIPTQQQWNPVMSAMQNVFQKVAPRPQSTPTRKSTRVRSAPTVSRTSTRGLSNPTRVGVSGVRYQLY